MITPVKRSSQTRKPGRRAIQTSTAPRFLGRNFGDGKIHAFSLATGQFAGTLRGDDRGPIVIAGLCDLMFGNGFLG